MKAMRRSWRLWLESLGDEPGLVVVCHKGCGPCMELQADLPKIQRRLGWQSLVVHADEDGAARRFFMGRSTAYVYPRIVLVWKGKKQSWCEGYEDAKALVAWARETWAVVREKTD